MNLAYFSSGQILVTVSPEVAMVSAQVVDAGYFMWPDEVQWAEFHFLTRISEYEYMQFRGSQPGQT